MKAYAVVSSILIALVILASVIVANLVTDEGAWMPFFALVVAGLVGVAIPLLISLANSDGERFGWMGVFIFGVAIYGSLMTGSIADESGSGLPWLVFCFGVVWYMLSMFAQLMLRPQFVTIGE